MDLPNLNAHACRMQSTCTPLNFKKTMIALDTANMKRFYDVDQKYVFEIHGLSTSTSPCGTTSRWKKLDCNSIACSSSTLSSDDTSLINTALRFQSGWLRDITVPCVGTPANALVQAAL